MGWHYAISGFCVVRFGSERARDEFLSQQLWKTFRPATAEEYDQLVLSGYAVAFWDAGKATDGRWLSLFGKWEER